MNVQAATGFAEWKAEVQSALSNLGDFARQERAWNSDGLHFFPDPIELCVRLVDDVRFAEFLGSAAIEPDIFVVAEGRELLEQIDAYRDAELADVHMVLSDPRWLAICALAKCLAERVATLSEGGRIN